MAFGDIVPLFGDREMPWPALSAMGPATEVPPPAEEQSEPLTLDAIRRSYFYAFYREYTPFLIQGLEATDSISAEPSDYLATYIETLSEAVAYSGKGLVERDFEAMTHASLVGSKSDDDIVELLFTDCAVAVENEIYRHRPYYEQLIVDILGKDQADHTEYAYPQLGGFDGKVLRSPGYSRAKLRETLRGLYDAAAQQGVLSSATLCQLCETAIREIVKQAILSEKRAIDLTLIVKRSQTETFDD